MGITSRPLYVPHLPQTRWGSLGSLHCGQIEAEMGVRKSWERRLFLLVLECRFTGFGMIHFPFF